MLDAKDQPTTIAATDDKTRELDRRQYVLQDGPCLDAAQRQVVNRWSLQEAEQRFPEFTSLAEEMGLRSYLSAGLGLAGRRLGALNLSSHHEDGFSQLDEDLISLFTVPASAAIVVVGRYAEARDLAAQLEHALHSRAVIDQAIGIVMAESRCDADQAFATLSRASNNRNMKLRDLAAEIVQRVGGRHHHNKNHQIERPVRRRIRAADRVRGSRARVRWPLRSSARGSSVPCGEE